LAAPFSPGLIREAGDHSELSLLAASVDDGGVSDSVPRANSFGTADDQRPTPPLKLSVTSHQSIARTARRAHVAVSHP
jgi:hypothetical protein